MLVSRVACRARALRGCRCGIIRVTIRGTTEVPASAKHLMLVSRVACRARALRGCRCGIIRVTFRVSRNDKKVFYTTKSFFESSRRFAFDVTRVPPPDAAAAKRRSNRVPEGRLVLRFSDAAIRAARVLAALRTFLLLRNMRIKTTTTRRRDEERAVSVTVRLAPRRNSRCAAATPRASSPPIPLRCRRTTSLRRRPSPSPPRRL